MPRASAICVLLGLIVHTASGYCVANTGTKSPVRATYLVGVDAIRCPPTMSVALLI